MTHETAQTREALVELMARAMLADELAVRPTLTFDPAWKQESDIWLSNATAALAALEAAGVNLMPSTLTKDMCYACMTSDQSATGADRVDYHAVLHRRYTAQLAASPYAKDAP